MNAEMSVVLLFVTALTFGRITGRRAWVYGLSMMALGVVLVAPAIALGD